jgi:hypothetical protein
MKPNIFDPLFSGLARASMYRSWVFADLFPDEPQPVLNNWTAEDLQAFCGIYSEVK